MTSEEKRAFLLLKTVIFHYHGLDEDEKQVLEETAEEIDATEELEWANQFIEEDYFNAFDRARNYLNNVMMSLNSEKRLNYLMAVWDANNRKGYISEMEATAMIKLARDWGVEGELIEMIKKQ
jgi:uncharacterized tellurite resistance protein B-like protein